MENNIQQSNNAAKFAFFYMLSLAALITLALASGAVIFQIINKSIADVLNQYSGSYNPDALKFAISALVIAAPIFYLTSRQITRNLFTGELPAGSGIRKWLTYFILFVSSVVMLGWLIATINSFLDGDLTLKFALKTITSIGIAAAIFTFYFYDIRRADTAGKRDGVVRIYFYASLAFVVAVFAASLFFVESPAETRNRKLDGAILENFSQIDNAINEFYAQEGRMPADLDEVDAETSYIATEELIDPVSREKYDYKIVGGKKYELCATFRASSKNAENNRYDYFYELWPHDAGYQCLPQKLREIENKPLAPIR